MKKAISKVLLISAVLFACPLHAVEYDAKWFAENFKAQIEKTGIYYLLLPVEMSSSKNSFYGLKASLFLAKKRVNANVYTYYDCQLRIDDKGDAYLLDCDHLSTFNGNSYERCDINNNYCSVNWPIYFSDSHVVK